MTDEGTPKLPAIRDGSGRFLPGNPGGPGPTGLALRVNKFRRTLLDTVTAEDIQAIARTLVREAKAGDAFSARLVLAYCLGEPSEIAKASAQEAQEAALVEQSYVALIPAPVTGDTQDERVANWVASTREVREKYEREVS